MKKILLIICVASSLFAQNINVQNGWQLLGATGDINVSKFNSTCVDYLWKYDSGDWQIHIANGQTYDLSNIQYIAALNQGDGFWAKGNSVSGCDINTTASQSDTTISGFTNEMLSTNPWYELEYGDNWAGCIGKKTYTIDGNFTHEEPSFSINGTYSIIDSNFSHIVDGTPMKSNELISATTDVIAYLGWNEDDTENINHKLFKNRDDAIAFGNSFGTDCSNYFPNTVLSNITEFSTEYLNGKTFYIVETNLYLKLEFTSTQFTYTEYNSDGSIAESASINYSIQSDGTMLYNDGTVMTLTNITDNILYTQASTDGVIEEWQLSKPADFPDI